MLDVSIRIGLLNVMASLRENEGVSFLYITHDIASARYVADRIFVMYAGHMVESGPIEEVLADPKHPYTQLLVAAVPDPRSPLTVTSEMAAGEPPKCVDPKARLPIPRPLSHRDQGLRRGHAAARRADPRPLCRVPRGRSRGRRVR